MRKFYFVALWSHKPENLTKSLFLPYLLFFQNTFWKIKKSYSSCFWEGSVLCGCGKKLPTKYSKERQSDSFSQQKFPNERGWNCNCYITFSCDFFPPSITPMPEFSTLVGLNPPHQRCAFLEGHQHILTKPEAVTQAAWTHSTVLPLQLLLIIVF